MEAKQQQIIEQSRHLFIYGKNGEEREQFLRSLEIHYPVKIDDDSPMAIYTTSFVLPIVKKENEQCNQNLLNLSARSYTQFALAESVTRKVAEDISKEVIDSRMDAFLKRINRLFLNRGKTEIESIEDLLQVLREARDFYKRYYVAEKLGAEKEDIQDLRIAFLELNGFVHYMKEALNNCSHFGFVIDHQTPFSVETTKSINELVSKRSNADISMKIALQPEEWEVYHEFTGMLIEATHDYGIVELDDSLKQYTYVKKAQMMGEY